ncbi:Uma2 family endonuclease [Saccharopolyspora indica]|nr:Uma2 family endonuclease [Saccharopolyspora indica]MDA3646000.1 Uma2 family endonuclease [Saccharopolyspora indica]
MEDWAALPEDNSHHVELDEGVLRVSSRPVSDHQWALMELGYQLRTQLPEHLVVLPRMEVVLRKEWPAIVRVPDLVVVPVERARESPPRYPAQDVLLAVEVVSPGSVGTDRVTKFAEYAEAGIPNYWIVDLGKPVSIAVFALKDGHYLAVEESAMALQLSAPAELTVDPAPLLPK